MRQLTRTPIHTRRTAPSSRFGYALWFPLTVYLLARLLDAVLILVAARHQIALPAGIPLPGYHIEESSPASPGYATVASNWDGQWYLRIATHGYPTTIPRDAAGNVLQNQWGFYPAYPLLIGAVMRISGLGFMVVAPIVSTLLGAAAVTVMFRLVNQVTGRFAASATVLLVCTYMAAPVMQIDYTESMALLLVCTALLLLGKRRYGWFLLVLVILALTRAVVLAFVPVVIVHLIFRYRRRFVEPFATRDRRQLVGLAALAVAVTGLWPAIAAVTTGSPAAYTQTMSSWSREAGRLRVLVEFPTYAWAHGGIVGLALLVLIVGLSAALVLRRGAAAWGPEIRAYAGCYPLFLLLATAPGSSNIRHLFLAFPLMWPFPEEAATRSERRFRVLLIAVLAVIGVALQWVWISSFLVVSGPPDKQLFP